MLDKEFMHFQHSVLPSTRHPERQIPRFR